MSSHWLPFVLFFKSLCFCRLIRDQLLAGDFTTNMRLLQVKNKRAHTRTHVHTCIHCPPNMCCAVLQDYPISDVHAILIKAKELQDSL